MKTVFDTRPPLCVSMYHRRRSRSAPEVGVPRRLGVARRGARRGVRRNNPEVAPVPPEDPYRTLVYVSYAFAAVTLFAAASTLAALALSMARH